MACPISGAAFKGFKAIESRPVSNAIEGNLGVKHESPQILLIRGGEVLWHASHGNISYEQIEQQVNARIPKA
ncbi:monothiol bacilliredoxin BrxC family protein [Saccharibacillus deserti]|uniref:monothiol bacilliredoxin BrxC family protein n=1 Tax=Saccharibacillus deserti TaxID=1634444 RepID=UPI001FEBA3BA|nr:monothiol bacilliredoxin BrxC family protein [Saccharibacillus deserti]